MIESIVAGILSGYIIKSIDVLYKYIKESIHKKNDRPQSTKLDDDHIS